jgi:divalent metal cation (Fe/Co/Zn/Cd) transporter
MFTASVRQRRRSQAKVAFRRSVLLNSGLSALQLAIGMAFGSLSVALIGDAVHYLSARTAPPRFT